MTILCDWEILARCMDQKMVVPFDQKLINPASLDVRLGDNLMIETMYQEDLLRLDISNRTEDAPYLLMPGHFCLAETLELFNIPDDISVSLYLSHREPETASITFWLVGLIPDTMAAASRSNLKTNDDTAPSSCGLG